MHDSRRFRPSRPEVVTAPAFVDAVEPEYGGYETVMVADDDAVLRRLLRNTLVAEGYRVIEARDGDEAVARFEEQPNDIHIAVIDQTMPGRDGFEALAAIRASAPELPAVLMSGSPIACEAADARAGFVAKPFDPFDLARIVRTTLDEAGA